MAPRPIRDSENRVPTSPELLVARLDRARSLARALIRDGAEADDVVQDAVLRALRRPRPVPADVLERPDGWLARTLTRLARDRARSDRRRAFRERSAARPERTPDGARAIENAEAQRELVDAVLRLSDPSRTVVLLSFFEGRSLRQIAALTGQSVEAVKKQRQRALSRLRLELEQSYGGDARWALALVPFAGRWRTWVAVRPVSAVGVAIAGGALLATAPLLTAASPDPARAVEGDGLPLASLDVEDRPRRVPVPARERPRSEEAELETTLLAPGPQRTERPRAIFKDRYELPELVRVPAGVATIGTSRNEIEGLHGDDRRLLRILDAQFPEHLVNVPDFWISRHEVTHEQYAEFVEATGHEPPLGWWPERAERRARKRYEVTARRSIQEGVPLRGWNDLEGEGRSPQELWWAANWREVGVEIPRGSDRQPVVNVGYADAVAYCEWLGLRLPTELEYQRAARGDDGRAFPWGFEEETRSPLGGHRANVEEIGLERPARVGRYPDGASPFGVLDLAGNVWEWTSSAYLPYPGFVSQSYVIGGEHLLPFEHGWSESLRVVVGGSFQEPLVASRAATRRGTDPAVRTDALGFRVASTLYPKHWHMR